MNLNLLRWLLTHRDLVAEIISAVNGYDRSLPPLQQWDIVDRVARIVIPALSDQDLNALRFAGDWGWDPDEAVVTFALGAECSANGIDWTTIAKVIIPILEIILKAITDTSDD